MLVREILKDQHEKIKMMAKKNKKMMMLMFGNRQDTHKERKKEV